MMATVKILKGNKLALETRYFCHNILASSLFTPI